MTKHRAAGHAAVLLLMAAWVGCRRPPPAPPPSSQAVVESYCEALLRKDWPRAYALLDDDSHQRCSSQRFAELAPRAIRKFGFVPEGCLVQSCQEQGDSAIAQVAFTASSASRRRFRDTIALRRQGDAWTIVLPDRFGASGR